MTRDASDVAIVISGAQGWMGRELICNLKVTSPATQIVRLPRINPESFAELEPVLSPLGEWTFVHLAFITREQILEIGKDSYVNANRQITDVAQRIIDLYRPTAVIHASSGAVFKAADVYGELKREQEEVIGSTCSKNDITCVNARIWSVSGAHCPKQNHFLFFDLLRQACFEDAVEIRASYPVHRRYVDAGQFLELALRIAQLGESATIDSGGELVTAYTLAKRMLKALGVRKPINVPSQIGPPDDYHSKSNGMQDWARKLKFTMGDLDWQIRNSLASIEQ